MVCITLVVLKLIGLDLQLIATVLHSGCKSTGTIVSRNISISTVEICLLVELFTNVRMTVVPSDKLTWTGLVVLELVPDPVGIP
jgi:hypothetical protein